MAAIETAKDATAQNLATRVPRRPTTRVVITGTGFSSHEREVLKEWVAQLAWQYSGDLVCGHSTHLVCRDLLAAFNEAKYVKAVHWGVTIVSFRWVYDSLQAGRLLQTAGYKSDNKGPADVALNEAVVLRKNLEAAHQAIRQPLQDLCQNSKGTAPDAGQHDGWDCGVPDQRKKRLAEQLQQPEIFTFDVPCTIAASDCSPRLCRGAVVTQFERAFAGATDQHLSDVGERPPSSETHGACAQPQDVAKQSNATMAEYSVQKLFTPRHDEEQQEPTQMPTPCSAEVSFSNLDEGLIVSAGAGCFARINEDGADNIGAIPASGVSCADQYILQRGANVHVNEDPVTGEKHRKDGTHRKGAETAADTFRPQRVGGSELGAEDCVDLLTPDPGAAAPPCKAAREEDAQRRCPEPVFLYSGFDLSLGVVATATKSRRLIRNDRMSQAAAGLATCQGNPEEALLEDEMEDDLEDDVENKTCGSAPPAGIVPAQIAALCAAGEGREDPPLLTAAAHPPRPSLANTSHSVKQLRNLFQDQVAAQQELLQQQQRAQRAKTDGRALEQDGGTEKPLPDASEAASEGFSTSAHLHQRHPRLPLQEPQQRPPCSQFQQTDLLAANAAPLPNVKPESGSEAWNVGPVALGIAGSRVPSITAARNEAGFPATARRTAAARATASLISEPKLIALKPADGTAAEPSSSRPRRVAAAAATSRLQDGVKDDADGNTSTSSMGDAPSGLDAVSDGPTPSVDSGRRTRASLDLPFQQLALEDCAASEDGEAVVGLLAKQREAKHAGTQPGPQTIARKMAARTRGVTPIPASRQREIIPASAPAEDSEPGEGLSDARRQRRPMYGPRARNATAMKPLPRVVTLPRDGTAGDISDDDVEDFVARPGAASQPCHQARPSSSLQTGLTESQTASQQLDDGSQLDQWPRNPLQPDQSITKYLEMSVDLAEKFLMQQGTLSSDGLVSDSQIKAIKALSRTPRNQSVHDRHPGVLLKNVKFAKSVTIEPLSLHLHSGDRSRRARCPIIALRSNTDDESREFFLAEPRTFYQLPNGEWWFEYYRYFSQRDVLALAKANNITTRLPDDFNPRREILRDMDTSHCRLIYVRGNMAISRTKKAMPPLGRPDQRPAFTRFMYDKHTGTPMTEQQAQDFVID